MPSPVDPEAMAAALRRAAPRADRLLALNLKLNTMRDPDALLERIIETAADVLGCEAASILLFDATTQKLRFAAATGSDPEKLARIAVPLDASLAGRIFRNNEALLIHDVARVQDHFDTVGQKVAFAAGSLVGVPMCIGDTPIGVLEGVSGTIDAFTEKDAAVLSIIAAQAAVAIRNARQLQALERANAALNRLDELKSDFLALASHELRTPLTMLLGYGAILEEEADPALAPHVEAILEATRRMETVVNTMAQMDVLRNEALVLDAAPIDLRDVLHRAIDEAAAHAGDREHTLSLDLSSVPLIVEADPERLRPAFVQLLDNAFAFTPDGGTVTVHAHAEGDHAHVVVCDTGVGIPDDEIERIFDEFYQVEDALTRSHGGLGVGLTIARKLIRLHDGRIWAAPAAQGACIHVHLPLASPRNGAP